MSPLRRRGTAQAGFPEDRGVWVGVAVVLTLLAWWRHRPRAVRRPPITTVGAVVRTLVLLLLAAIPVAALVWAWKRLSRRAQAHRPHPHRRAGGVPGAVRPGPLAASTPSGCGWGRDPGRLADRLAARATRQLWAVSDSLNAVHVPPVAQPLHHQQVRLSHHPGTDGMTVNAKHARYRQSAAERAEAYNDVHHRSACASPRRGAAASPTGTTARTERPVRILFANDGMGDAGGVQNYLAAVMPALRGAGHAVALLHLDPAAPRRAARRRRRGRRTSPRRSGGWTRSSAAALAWGPDVAFVHNMRPLEVDGR